MFCKDCGEKLTDNLKFCRHCGALVKAATPEQADHSPASALEKAARQAKIKPQLEQKSPVASFETPPMPPPAQRKTSSQLPKLLVSLVVAVTTIAGGAYLISTEGDTIAQWFSNSEDNHSGQIAPATSAQPPTATSVTTPADTTAKPTHSAVVVKKKSSAPPTTAAYPSAATPSYPPAADAKTIDETYKERHGRECNSGVTGLFCREQIRLSVCDGKWTSESVPGRTICHVQKNSTDNGQYGG